jgi:hypothetical protein
MQMQVVFKHLSNIQFLESISFKKSNPLVTLFLVLFLWFLSGSTLYSQIIFTDTGEETPYHEIMDMCTKAKDIIDEKLSTKKNNKELGKNTIARMDILEIQDKKYLLLDAFFDVYEWRDNEWINLYKGGLSGYNHGSRKFVLNDKIYSFGGYGYWNSHGQVIGLDVKYGEWELIPVTKNFKQGYSYLDKNRKNLHVITPDGEYEINIPENKIIKSDPLRPTLKKLMDGKSGNSSSYETDSFFLNLRGKPTVLIHKPSHKCFINDEIVDKLMELLRLNTFVQIRGNDFRIIDPAKGPIDTLTEARIEDFFHIGNANDENNGTPRTSVILITLLTVSAFAAFIYIKKRKRQHLLFNDQNTDTSVIAKFKSYEGKTITLETLDEIFEIQHIISNETQRSKRASLIKQINQMSKSRNDTSLIQRIQDPQDGRRYLYEIKSIIN